MTSTQPGRPLTALMVLSTCPRCHRGYLGSARRAELPYHERPPLYGDEGLDGIGPRPCAGSFQPPAQLTRQEHP